MRVDKTKAGNDMAQCSFLFKGLFSPSSSKIPIIFLHTSPMAGQLSAISYLNRDPEPRNPCISLLQHCLSSNYWLGWSSDSALPSAVPVTPYCSPPKPTFASWPNFAP